MEKKIDERTLKAMEYFKEHWREQSCTPTEVAKRFSLTPQTVRNHLQEIADELSDELEREITRDTLLEKPQAEHVCYERAYEPVKPVDLKQFRERFEKTKSAMDSTRKEILATIEEISIYDDED